MSIKEIIDKHYKSDKLNFDVKEDELDEFSKEFMAIKKLKEEYDKGFVNRKTAGQEILTRGEKLKELMHIFEQSILNSGENYKYPEYISDYNIIFELILKILNNDNPKYILKMFNVEQIGSFETIHGDRESRLVQGEIWVIGKKNSIDDIDNTKPYYGAEFRNLVTKIVNDGNSVVIITNYCYESNVMPYNVSSGINVHKFSVDGIVSDLCCYTYEDELGNVIKKLDKYIDKYGGDVDNISIDTLISRIEELNIEKLDKNQKVLVKTKNQE